jgi:hypothetical protein
LISRRSQAVLDLAATVGEPGRLEPGREWRERREARLLCPMTIESPLDAIEEPVDRLTSRGSRHYQGLLTARMLKESVGQLLCLG